MSDHSKPASLCAVLSAGDFDELLLPDGGLHHMEEEVKHNPGGRGSNIAAQP